MLLRCPTYGVAQIPGEDALTFRDGARQLIRQITGSFSLP
jgi:hypothetical protein